MLPRLKHCTSHCCKCINSLERLCEKFVEFLFFKHKNKESSKTIQWIFPIWIDGERCTVSGVHCSHLTRRKHCKQQCHLHTAQDQISWNQYQFNDVDEKQSILLLCFAGGEQERRKGEASSIFYIHGDIIIYSIVHRTLSKQ